MFSICMTTQHVLSFFTQKPFHHIVLGACRYPPWSAYNGKTEIGGLDRNPTVWFDIEVKSTTDFHHPMIRYAGSSDSPSVPMFSA